MVSIRTPLMCTICLVTRRENEASVRKFKLILVKINQKASNNSSKFPLLDKEREREMDG
jgi:hypothetical protein